MKKTKYQQLEKVVCIPLLITVYVFFSTAIECQTQNYTCQNTGLTEEVESLQMTIYRRYWDKGMTIADSLLEIFEDRKLMDCEEALWTILYRSDGYEQDGNVDQSMSEYHEIIPTAIRHGYWELLAETYLSLARSHEISGRSIDTKRYLDEAEKLINKRKLEKAKARWYSRSSSYFRVFEHDLEIADGLAQKAISQGNKYNHIRATSDGYLLQSIFIDNLEDKEVCFTKGKELNIKYDAPRQTNYFLLNLVMIHIAQNKLDLANSELDFFCTTEQNLLKNIKVKGRDYYRDRYRFHDLKHKIFQKKNQVDSINHHRKLSLKFYEKSKREHDHQAINQLEIKKAVEIEKLKAKNLEYQLYFSKIAGIAGLSLLLTLSAFLYLLYSNRKKLKEKNELISEQIVQLSKLSNKQELLLSEVHHRVKNNLQNVISLLTIQEQNIEDIEVRNQLKDISGKIYSIALIHEQLYQFEEFEHIDMKGYFDELAVHYKSISNLNIEPIFNIELNDIKMNIETAIPLGIIVAELITNSIKYIPKELQLLVELKIKKDLQGKYIMQYKDNGNGYSQDVISGKKSGMGMMLIRSMCRQLQAQYRMTNNEGAAIEISFKEKNVSEL